MMNINFLQGDLSEEITNTYMESKFISTDTETLGLNNHRDRLCLVQLCNEDGLVTLLKITNKNTPNLKKVLENDTPSDVDCNSLSSDCPIYMPH